METRYIYLLKNPETNNGFYIGQAKNLLSRLSSHIKGCENGKHPKDEILRNIKRLGVVPIIEKLEEVIIDGSSISFELLAEKEKYWITYYKDKFKLYNIEHNTQPSLKSTPTSKKCKRCADVFYPNKPKQVFCSDKCRVYFSRENKTKIIEVTKTIPEIGTPIGDNHKVKSIKKGDGFNTLTISQKYNTSEPPRLKGESSIEYRLRMIELKEAEKE